MLIVENIHKRFGGTEAVDGVGFSVQPGEIVALIGPNGSGKTTTVKVIAGLLQPDQGRILIAGTDMVLEPLGAKQGLGYVPDDPNVWSGMTGEEFLHFTGALYGVPEKARSKRIAHLLEQFDLGGIERNYFEDYSRGNKQKFTIMAALLHEPKVLLVDEPIVGLDPGSVVVAKRLFKEFANKGGSLLLVTHTLPVAQELADKIGILLYSKLVAFGTMAELRVAAHIDAKGSLEDIYNAMTA
jgi:ABC-2 type transport system ATP-binding protein